MPRYQLSVYAESLKRGRFKRPNPYAEIVVFGGPRDGEKIGRTEIVHNTRNPDFTKVFFIETDPSINLPLKVSIYNDTHRTLLAEAIFEATEVFVSPGHFQVHKDSGAKIYASVEESLKGTSQGRCTMHLRGLDIKNVEPGIMGLGRSDPFFEISRKNADHAAGVVRWNTIYRSEYISDHLNPFWEEFTLSLEELCYGDMAWPLKVTVYDHNDRRSHKEIGNFETSIQEMSQRISIRGNADRERAFEIIREDTTKTRGLIVVLKVEVYLEDAPESGT